MKKTVFILLLLILIKGSVSLASEGYKILFKNVSGLTKYDKINIYKLLDFKLSPDGKYFITDDESGDIS